jgi:hypothetical protein
MRWSGAGVAQIRGTRGSTTAARRSSWKLYLSCLLQEMRLMLIWIATSDGESRRVPRVAVLRCRGPSNVRDLDAIDVHRATHLWLS